MSEENFFWLSAQNLKDIPCNEDPREIVDSVHAKYVLLKGAFMSKDVATFGLNLSKKCFFLLQLFRTQMYVLTLDCYHWDKRDNGVMCLGGSPNIKAEGMPVGNFHDKHY